MKVMFPLLVLAACLVGCRHVERTPFDDVVDYYAERMESATATEADTLKFKAAEYLREHSDCHYGVPRHLADSLGRRTELDHKAFSSDTLYRRFLDSNGYRYMNEAAVYDSDTITTDFLIENIELAFDSWGKPWASDVPFDDFCRYILPHRVGDEELSGWRRKFKDKYEHTIADSVENTGSIREVALYLMRRLKGDVAYGTRLGTFYKDLLTPEEMERMHTLECKALAHYGTLALRACGVPCAMIETNWRFTEVVHNSILIPQTGGNSNACRLSIYDEIQDMGTPKDSMATWRSWIFDYEPNPDLVELLRTGEEEAREFAKPVNRTDITPIFSTTHSFSLPVPDGYRAYKYLFLCRFHEDRWYLIREGKVDGDSVRFKDATIRQLYRLGVMEDGMVRTFGKMFSLTGDGRMLHYDSSGDSVRFVLNFDCKPEEAETLKVFNIYKGGDNGDWESFPAEGLLWSINEKTGEYRLFDESLRGTFKPVFHQIKVRQPKHTVFTHEKLPRPIGFLFEDTIANEGHYMAF